MNNMLRHDARFSIRLLADQPIFTVTTIGVLAVGIGLTSAVFGLADPYVLRPLPYPDPDRLVSAEVRSKAQSGPAPVRSLQRPTLQDLRARQDIFERVALYTHSGTVRGRLNGATVALRIVTCTDALLEILGVPGVLASGDESLVLTASAALRLSIDQAMGGRLVKEDGAFLPIAGVLPNSFVFPSNHYQFPIDAILVRKVDFSELTSGTVIALLRPNVPWAAARDAIRAMTPPASGLEAKVEPLWRFMAGKSRTLGLAALAAVTLFFVIATANVGNLLLAHSLARSREIAIRSVLGATRSNLLRLMFVELGLLCVTAIILGVAIASIALAAAGHFAPVEYLALGSPRLTARVCAVATASGGVLFVVGGLSQWASWHRSSSRGSAASRDAEAPRTRRLRLVAATVQAALAMVLIAGAAFLTRSYVNLTSQDTGMTAEVIIATVGYPDQLVGSPLQQVIDTTVNRLRRMGRVDQAAAAIGPMVDRTVVMGGLIVRGGVVVVTPFQVSPGYFETIGAKILSGRPLLPIDQGKVGVVVNERLARLAWPGDPAVGQRVGSDREAEVVGVVRDTFSLALDVPPVPAAYSVLDNPTGCRGECNRVNYLIRGRNGTSKRDLVLPMTTEITTASHDAIVLEVSSVGDRLGGSVKDRSFATLVLALFGVGALIICGLGLAGLTAFVVTCRTRELAIRSSLGAQTSHLIRSVLVQATLCTAAGVLIGGFAAAWMSRFLTGFLFGVAPGDPPTLLVAVLLVLAVAGGASLIPALRVLQLPLTLAMRPE